MKKYFFEAPVTQWEKSAEHDYLFCAPARCLVLAEDEKKAFVLAEKKFRSEYAGTGRLLLGEMKLTKVAELPVDWNYGYDNQNQNQNQRKAAANNKKAMAKLVADTVIK